MRRPLFRVGAEDEVLPAEAHHSIKVYSGLHLFTTPRDLTAPTQQEVRDSFREAVWAALLEQKKTGSLQDGDLLADALLAKGWGPLPRHQ